MDMEGALVGDLEEVKVKEDPWKDFKLPYSVATLEDYHLRAYFTDHDTVEWLWSRIHDTCKIQTSPGKMLATNTESIYQDMDKLLVPREEFHYRGDKFVPDQKTPWKQHTVESRGFFALGLWLLKNRSLKATAKTKCLEMLLGVLQLCLGIATGPILAMMIDPSGALQQSELHFESTGVCRDGWANLLAHSQGAREEWGRLSKSLWMGYCLTSTIEAATFKDICFFLMWLYCHPKATARGQNLFRSLALQTLPSLINKAGAWLSSLAVELSKKELSVLPMLKTKTGQCRRVADPVNRMILMQRLRKEKLHRRKIAATHQDVNLGNSRLLQYEAFLDCFLHGEALASTFAGERQVCVAWDPSSYGGKEVMVAAIYSTNLDKAAWLLNQQMGQVMLSELHESLLPMARQSKLDRITGYNELRALSAALRGAGLTLMNFQVPTGLIVRPLQAHECRVKSESGEWFIYDLHTQTAAPEKPANLQLGKVPVLCSISDQGPINTAALNFAQYSPAALMLHAQYDPFHRAWNDLKTAFKKTSSTCKAWRVVLQLTIVANVSYGPFGSSQWHYKKLAKMEEFFATRSIMSTSWKKYQHLICQEMRQLEPESREDAEALFQSMKNLPSFTKKGPLVKLMRWFSFFESMAFLAGQFWVNKMIFQENLADNPEKEEAEDFVLPEEEKDPAKELQELKKKQGSWTLAPKLITEKSLCVKDCIMAIGKATWKSHASRARSLTSTLQVCQYNVSCAASSFWAAELEEIVEASLWDEKGLKHLLPQWRCHEEAIAFHEDLFGKVLEARATSLVAFHCIPPHTYHHSVSQDMQVARAAFQKARKEWEMLQEIESAAAHGAVIEPLSKMHWRFSPFVRTLLLAYEEDLAFGRLGGDSQAKRLQLLICKTLGDSRLVEMAHQTAKDILRAKKDNTFANTAIMSKVLSSQVLEKRKLATVTISNAEKITAETNRTRMSSVVGRLKASTHKLPKQIQDIMQPVPASKMWPSPSPASLFQSAAATKWLFDYWSQQDALPGVHVDCNSSWLCALATPGTCVAQKSTGSIVRVIAAAEFGLLAWRLAAHVLPDGQVTFRMEPNRMNLVWEHILDLEDWAYIPTEMMLLTEGKGPIVFKKTDEAMPLQHAICFFGLPLTVAQIRRLILLLGGPHLPGMPSRQHVEETLFQTIFSDEALPEVRAKVEQFAKAGIDQDDIDSELSEILSELDQEDGNKQDLKDLKTKRKQQRAAKRFKAEREAAQKSPETAEAKAAQAEEAPEAGPSSGSGIRRPWSEGQSTPAPPTPAPSPEPAPKAPSEATPAPATPAPGTPAPRTPGAPRASAPKVYKSPEEVLSKLSPPGCVMGLSYMDHRFTSRYPVDSAALEGLAYAKKTMTASFAQKRSWEDALRLVHRHCWEKWGIIRADFPLQAGEVEQTPGHIPPDIIEALTGIIKTLPEVTVFELVPHPWCDLRLGDVVMISPEGALECGWWVGLLFAVNPEHFVVRVLLPHGGIQSFKPGHLRVADMDSEEEYQAAGQEGHEDENEDDTATEAPKDELAGEENSEAEEADESEPSMSSGGSSSSTARPEILAFDTFDEDLEPSDHHFVDRTPPPPKALMRAVRRELSALRTGLLDGGEGVVAPIMVRTYASRSDLFRAMVVGPPSTPYADVPFFFDLAMSPQYPAEPPLVHYLAHFVNSSERLNPNLYRDGKVCLSLLGTWAGPGWDPSKSTLLQVLVSLQGLVLVEDPYFNEPGHGDARTDHGHQAAALYNENARLLSLRAALNTAQQPPKGFEEVVAAHFAEKGPKLLAECEEAATGSHSEGFRQVLSRSILPQLREVWGSQSWNHGFPLPPRRPPPLPKYES
ncbi:Probable ubiquitin-conjugating enzyme E2 23 (E2 ubiquitin-conjugating enzyme 23) (Ubiquitin carrier protein 23) [Durusdinium trenchii]|uniref:Probable ubiquitin-conjugating enzyme E2 23 (E2 ubiquitin-conjugating enzyme 23) (Ubiquitin carrier protein 23) n=1 Tax=Durusdinium trenchii TaxID=1381693 RepID=A0ABP0QXH9_9DINO